MKKGTKKWFIEEIKKALEEHKVYSEKLDQLVDEGKINSGWILVYGNTNIYPYKWLFGFGGQKCKLYGWVYEETKVQAYKIQLSETHYEIEKIKEFLEKHTSIK